jgi:alginate O-acetyltransferase complex protein AlgI
MAFNSFLFIFFLIIVIPLYYLIPARYRNIFLLLVSYSFYSYSDVRFIALILIVTITTFYAGRKIYGSEEIKTKKHFLIFALVVNLTVLGIFKYFNFFIDSTSNMLSLFGYKLDYVHLNIILPLGISFYTFQALTYVFDIYYQTLTPTKSFINFALFVSFFPTITAGPIERAKRLIPQFEKNTKFSKENFKEGITLISVGMFRKVLIGDTCGRIVDHIFGAPKYFLSAELLMAVLLYALQIYNDFAGYSSIARGTAKLLGIDIMENFNQPYFSKSVAEFWRRWHISLSFWLRDYLFTPLQLKYRKLRKWGNVLAISITFLLCGLWHGAAWTFVFWGFLHGFFMSFSVIVNKQRQSIYKKFNLLNSKPLEYFKILFTFVILTIAWVFFRANSFSEAFYFLNHLIRWNGSEFTFRIVLIISTFYFITFVIDFLEYHYKTHSFLLKLDSSFRYAFLFVNWAIVLMYLFTSRQLPFVYSQF